MVLNNYWQSKIALGSEVIINLVSNIDISEAERNFEDIWDQINLFEKRFSRFIYDSELSSFNRNAGTKQFISQEFKDILTSTIDYWRLTNGLYNPFVLPALQSAGYTKSFVSNKDIILDDFSNKTMTTPDKIKLGSDWALIPYGTAIDLGGIGKGYLANQLGNKLDKLNLEGYSISLGGDIVVNGSTKEKEPWVIDILDANDPLKVIGKVRVPENMKYCIATSGITKRKGVKNGTDWHHIIDPMTQKPAITDIKNITICTELALDADIFATCSVIFGSNGIGKLLSTHGISNYLVQYTDNKDELCLKSSGNFIEITK